MKNHFSQEIFRQRYLQADTAFDFTHWELHWAPEQVEREAQREEIKKEYQADVLEMGKTPCCAVRKTTGAREAAERIKHFAACANFRFAWIADTLYNGIRCHRWGS